MFGKLLCLAAFVTLGYCAPTATPECVPDQTNFYWTSPCSDQKFTNVFTPTDIECTQNGQSLDSLGGIDATQDLTCVITIQNDYDKTLTTPLVDIGLQDYSKSLGKCKWSDVPGAAAVLKGLNMCDIVDNCHMDNPPNPTQFTVTVNIANLAGPFIGILKDTTYYGISLTFRDDKTDLACAYVQDEIIKV